MFRVQGEKMKADNRQLSPRSLIRFLEAPDRAQEEAKAREDFLHLFTDFQGAHKELSKGDALEKFLNAFNRGRIGESIREGLIKKRVRRSTFYNWQRDFSRYGISGLLPGWNNGGCRINPKVREEIERFIWSEHLCRYVDIYNHLRIKFPKENLPSYSAVRSYAKYYKEQHQAALVLKFEGVKGLRDRGMDVALGRRDEDVHRPNQRWEIDTTIADLLTGRKVSEVVLLTKDGKRCKIIGIVDVYSRLAKFYLTEKETALEVGRVLRDRMLDWGLPEELVIDNGATYKNNRILSFLRSLTIAVFLCLPGTPEEKPHIERIFRTLTEQLFRRLPGYSGNSVATRPNEIEVKYTKSELQGIIDDYVTNVYAETVHRTTGQRPRERMSPPGFQPRRPKSERELDIFLMEVHTRKVRQGFICYEGGKYFHPSLPEGKTVTIRVNDFDASELLVFVDRKFLCIAEDYGRKGRTPQQIREAKKERNRELRTRIKAHEALIDKDRPKDANILDLIKHHKETKPTELPKKAELVTFPDLKNIHYTRPENEASEDSDMVWGSGENEEPRIFKSRREKYIHIIQQKQKGKTLNKNEEEFLKDYEASDEYGLVRDYLEREVEGL
jgi:putative transposase